MRIKPYLALIFLFTTLSGCVTARLRLLERADLIRADIVDGTDNIYVVRMNEVNSLGWDARNKNVREETLHEMFDSSCKNIVVFDEKRAEDPLVSGEGMIAYWVLSVRCEK